MLDKDTYKYTIATVVLDGLIISACIVELFLLITSRCVRCTSKFEPIERLLLSLCLSDLLCGFSSFVIDSMQLKNQLFSQDSVVTTIFYQFADITFMFFLLVSNFHVIGIAIERFIAVALPQRYSIFETNCCKTCTIFMIWTMAIITAPCVFLLLFKTITKNDKRGKLLTSIYGVILMTGCIVVLVTYSALFVMLIIRDRKLSNLLPPGEEKRRLRSKRNTFICLLLGLSYFVCVFPWALGYLSPKLYFDVSNTLITANHIFNPLVYFIKYYFDRRRRSPSLITTQREFSLTQTSNTSY